MHEIFADFKLCKFVVFPRCVKEGSPEFFFHWQKYIRDFKIEERAAGEVRYEIASIISDQNFTPLISIAILLQPFWNPTIQ